MSLLPTEKVQEMIAKLQEYRASVLVKIDEKNAELEALLLQKFDHVRLEERRRCALLLRSLMRHGSGGCTPEAGDAWAGGVTQLRITTPPPSTIPSPPADAPSNQSETSHVATRTLTAQQGRPVALASAQDPTSRNAAGALSASLLDTVVLSPMTPINASANQSYTAWLPTVEAFLEMAESEQFPSWSFGVEAHNGHHREQSQAGAQIDANECESATCGSVAQKRVRFSSKSPQIAVFSVERSPVGTAVPREAPQSPTVVSERTGGEATEASLSSDATSASRSSAEIRTEFCAHMAVVKSHICHARNNLLNALPHQTHAKPKSRRSPLSPGPYRSHGAYTLEAASPSSDRDSPLCDWLDPLNPHDTNAAHGDNSPSFADTPILRPPTIRAAPPTSGSTSLTVDSSTLARDAKSQGTATVRDNKVRTRPLARKVRILEASRTSRGSTGVTESSGSRTVRTNDKTVMAFPTRVTGLCGNISLACGPTVYFSD